jgi:hypothetical protein
MPARQAPIGVASAWRHLVAEIILLHALNGKHSILTGARARELKTASHDKCLM